MDISTPEGYLQWSWLTAEQAWKGPVEFDLPAPPPHPNEIATREAVAKGIYTAQDVGLANP